MRIEYDLLKQELKKPNSKEKIAFNDSIILSSLLSLISNLIYGAEQMKVNELAMFVSSLNHWMTNKTLLNKRTFKVGDIIEFECGLNYSGELAYRHTGIILGTSNTHVMVVPSTSGTSYKQKSSEKYGGLWYYYLVGEQYGFEHECVLLLNNLKVVSKQRIIAKFKNAIEFANDGMQLIDDLKETLIMHYFEKQYNQYQTTIADLKSYMSSIEHENNVLKEQNMKLIQHNQSLEDDIKKHKEKIKSFYRKFSASKPQNK